MRLNLSSVSVAAPALLASAIVVALASAYACGKKSSDTNESPGQGEGGTLETKFAPTKLTSSSNLTGEDTAANLSGSSSIFGQSAPDAFTSAKFRVSAMTLCGKVSATGGDACEQRPWQIFKGGEESTNEYNEFVPAKALDFKDWIDFLNPSSTAKLASKATYNESFVGSYEAVIVNFYRAFKIKAAVQMNDGKTLYTKNSKDFKSNGKSGLDVTYTNVSTDLTVAPAEEATMFLPNGGKTFFLQSPFQITADDVAKKTSFKMVLAYDPNNAIKGQTAALNYPTSAGAFLEGQFDSTNGYLITAPFMEFTPVLARTSETIMRETYEIALEGFEGIDSAAVGSPYSVRFSLYYVKEDATKAVRGVTSTLVYNENTFEPIGFNPLGGIRRVTTGADKSLNFLYNSQLSLIKGFKRLAKAGDTGTGTATLCLGPTQGATCEARYSRNVNFTYSLASNANVDSAVSIDYKPLPTVTPTTTPAM